MQTIAEDFEMADLPVRIGGLTLDRVMAATAKLAREDRATGTVRPDYDAALTVLDRLGHSRKTVHGATYGACEFDPWRDAIAATYRVWRDPQNGLSPLDDGWRDITAARWHATRESAEDQARAMRRGPNALRADIRVIERPRTIGPNPAPAFVLQARTVR